MKTLLVTILLGLSSLFVQAQRPGGDRKLCWQERSKMY